MERLLRRRWCSDTVSEGFDAVIFYFSAAALVGGVIRAARAAVERRALDRWAIALAVGGLAGLAIAAVLFAAGPKSVLPF